MALLSARTWSARYGADPSIVGRVVRVNTIPTTIVGVMGEVALINEGNTGLWLPFVPGERGTDRGWGRLVAHLHVEEVTGLHHDVMNGPHVVRVANAIDRALRRLG